VQWMTAGSGIIHQEMKRKQQPPARRKNPPGTSLTCLESWCPRSARAHSG
jgi:redox-sensitive bicupin YhaK (pirin superfamily)